MKRLALGALLAVAAAIPAQAADLPVKAPPPIIPLYNWSGFYIGGNLGYSWGRTSTDFNTTIAAANSSGSADIDGWIGGGQIGINWQTGAMVWGLEGDIQATGQKGGVTATCPLGVCVARLDVSADQKLTWVATFRARLGWLVMPTTLLYVTGGLAAGEVKTDVTLTATDALGAVQSVSGGTATTKTGWTIGAGLETALGASNWTGKIEYLYVDLGSIDNTVTATAGVVLPAALTVASNSRVTDNIIRFGLNYRFGR
jgi:outer membrane immunogenic protein